MNAKGEIGCFSQGASGWLGVLILNIVSKPMQSIFRAELEALTLSQ